MIDETNGIITFKRNCDLSGHIKTLEKTIKDIYIQEYPCIKFETLLVEQKSTLPYNFEEYTLENATINSARLKKESGTLSTTFKKDSKQKKIYFEYSLKASILAFKAKHNMLNDKILTQNDYEIVNIPLENLPSNLISCSIEENLMSKSYIREDTLLTYNKIELKKDLLKGTQLRSYIIDGSLVIGVDTILQEDANIGDKVRVKTHDSKFFSAKLISKTEAMILK